MSSDDSESDVGEEIPVTVEEADDDGARGPLEKRADRAVEGFDQGLVDLLSWILDTETRARIYVFLRQSPHSTSQEVAEGTGLYPSTVREALADMHAEGTLERRKRDSEGAGNNPFEYTAIPPSDLVKGVVGDMQHQLNQVINLDRYLGGETGDPNAEDEPITISVDVPDAAETDDEAADSGDEDDDADDDPVTE